MISDAVLKSWTGSAIPCWSITESNYVWRNNWLDYGFQGLSSELWAQSVTINIFARNLPRQCTSSVFQFADDATLATEDPSLSVVADNLMVSFETVKKICDSHDLKINSEKTQLIFFKKQGKSIPDDFYLTLDSCIIKPEKTLKLLGVTLDQYLTFGPLDNVVKCQGVLAISANATSYLPKELLKLLYTALIRSHMEYCSSLLSSAQRHI